MNEIKAVMSRSKKTTEKVSMEPLVDDLDSDWPQSAGAYELKCLIGQGAFAKVYQARCEEKNADCAIKVMELDNLSSSLEDIFSEVRVMMLSKNPYVLRAYACFVVKRSLWLVMPLLRKGSCLRIMKVLKRAGLGEGMKEEWIAAILKCALEGLEYLHKQGKVHRDIKASNMLMDSNGNVMVSDFGVAGWLPNPFDRNESERRTFVGTPCWMAPEVMEQTAPYDEKADIWSFGITALELAKGYAPYARLPPMKVLLMTIQNAPPSLKTYEDYQKTKSKFSRSFKEIITLCLQKNPQNRPSASTLLSKSFFKKAPPPSFLAKDLLEGAHIPDTSESTAITSSTSKDRAREHDAYLEKILQDQQEEIQKQLLRQQQQAAETAAVTPATSGSNVQATVPVDPSATVPVEATSAPQPGVAAADSGAPSALNNTKLKTIAKLEKLQVGGGASFVKGSTWVFDDEDDAPPPAAAPPAAESVPAETSPAIQDPPAAGGAAAGQQPAQPPAAAPQQPPAPVAEGTAAPLPSQPSPGKMDDEDDGFAEFENEYAAMGIKGEDGRISTGNENPSS